MNINYSKKKFKTIISAYKHNLSSKTSFKKIN